MPPENSCGNCDIRSPGEEIPTSASARSHASRLATRLIPGRCSSSDSSSCSPMLITGFRLVMGSWKIIAISAPRMDRRVRSPQRNKSVRSPARRRSVASPPHAASLGSNPIAARAVTVLPLPDSPTIAIVRSA